MVNKLKSLRVKELTALLAKILPESSLVNLDSTHLRRLEITIRTHLGQSQAEICAAVGCSKDTARYWMAIAQTEKASSWQEHSVGRPKTVNDQYLNRLKELVTSNPKDYGYAFERWTARWLSQHLAEELGIEISPRHVNRLLKQMGLSTRNKKQSKETQKPTNSRGGIAIEDLNPADLSQLKNSPWWLQNKA